MKKGVRVLLAALLLAAGQSYGANDDGQVAAATQLLDAMNMRVNLERTVEQVTLAEVRKNPKLAPYQGVMLEFMRKYMGYDSLKDDLVQLYSDTFSRTELEELARFYQTPVGKKTIEKLPELTVQGARLGQKKVQAHLGELKDMINLETERLKTLEALQAPEEQKAK